MIHYWECKKCTTQWTSCCFGHLFMDKEEKALAARKPYDLCDRCFLELERSDDQLLHVLNLKTGLDKTAKTLDGIIDNLSASLGFGWSFKVEAHIKSLIKK